MKLNFYKHLIVPSILQNIFLIISPYILLTIFQISEYLSSFLLLIYGFKLKK
jgi:hypothetical protein